MSEARTRGSCKPPVLRVMNEAVTVESVVFISFTFLSLFLSFPFLRFLSCILSSSFFSFTSLFFSSVPSQVFLLFTCFLFFFSLFLSKRFSHVYRLICFLYSLFLFLRSLHVAFTCAVCQVVISRWEFRGVHLIPQPSL